MLTCQRVEETDSFVIYKALNLCSVLSLCLRLPLRKQLSGINVVFYFSSIVFKSAGVPSQSANICVGIPNLLGSFVALLLVDKLGRKVLLIGSFLGMAVAMGLQAASASSLVASSNEVHFSVGGMLLFILTFAMGAGPVPGVLLLEMFLGWIRAKAMSVCMAVHWVTFLNSSSS
ncbi:hypothetical protein PTKIN_Ptkin18bG0061700 [Pterospermum kingtungense]